MKIHLEKLVLLCRKSEELIDFSHQISYFHGRISAGKSSIVRLIDYCFGGDLEKTPALTQEMVAARLFVTISEYSVLFERGIADTTSVQVTWVDKNNQSATVLAPINAGQQPVWGDDVFNLSDLIFFLAKVRPIKVRRSKQDADSPLVRLSFRDVMWYCYLDQDTLDSSFYNLNDQFKRLKSRDVMRFITGLYTERLNELEIKLEEIRDNRSAKLESIKQIRSFLSDFGYSTEAEVSKEIFEVETQLTQVQEILSTNRKKYSVETHFVDNLRQDLRKLSDLLAMETENLSDLETRVKEQESLLAELLSAKFKLSRVEAASALLSGVKFNLCPACGHDLEKHSRQIKDDCYLCGHPIQTQIEEPVAQPEAIRRDLDSRIDDISESIKRHKLALKKQLLNVDELRKQKMLLDNKLNQELQNYDSAFLADNRERERFIASLEERKKNLEKISKLPEAISRMEKESDGLIIQGEQIKREIEIEKSKLTDAEKRIKDIEVAYLDALRETSVPGIEPEDRIVIDVRNWIPKIVPSDGDAYDFYNAGSGGKKTLLNVCYALAVHSVAQTHGLFLPTFLMIDTPMKNIGEDVNEDIFKAFYRYLYKLADTILHDVQFVIIDKEFYEPQADFDLDVRERFMSPEKPLISYYRGP